MKAEAPAMAGPKGVKRAKADSPWAASAPAQRHRGTALSVKRDQFESAGPSTKHAALASGTAASGLAPAVSPAPTPAEGSITPTQPDQVQSIAEAAPAAPSTLSTAPADRAISDEYCTPTEPDDPTQLDDMSGADAGAAPAALGARPDLPSGPANRWSGLINRGRIKRVHDRIGPKFRI